MTMPPSTLDVPATEWPPARTAISRPGVTGERDRGGDVGGATRTAR